MSKTLKMRGLKVAHFLISIGLFVICWKAFYLSRYSTETHFYGEIVLYLLYAFVLFLMNRTYDSYDVGYHRVSDNIYSQTLSQIITAGIIWIVSLLMFMSWTNPLPLLSLCLVLLIVNSIWCVAANRIYKYLHANKKTVVIYEDDEDLQRLKEVGELEHKFNVQKYIKDPRDYKELEPEIEGFEAIVVSGINATLRNGLAKYCIETGVLGYFAPHVGDIIMQGSRHMRNFSVPILSVRRAEPTPEYLFLKRAFDIVVSAIGLVVLSPFIGITAVAVKLYDHGPVLYKQVRLTKDRKEFKILNLRWMQVVHELHKIQARIRWIIGAKYTTFWRPSDFRHSIAGFAGVFAA